MITTKHRDFYICTKLIETPPLTHEIDSKAYVCFATNRHHCEMNFINKVVKSLALKKGWTIMKTARTYFPKIWLVNFDKYGEFKNSKPCAVCHKLIFNIGIKVVYYEDGEWIENFTNEIPDTRLSSYYKFKKRLKGTPFPIA